MNTEYEIEEVNALNSLDQWELEIHEDSWLAYLRNPTSSNASIISANNAELSENLQILSKYGTKLPKEGIIILKRLLSKLEEVRTGDISTQTKGLIDEAVETIKEYLDSVEEDYYKYPKQELSEDGELSNLEYQKLSPVDREIRIENARKRAVECLLQDARDSGINIYSGEKEVTIDELVNEAIERIRKAERWRTQFHSHSKYGSQNIPEQAIRNIQEGLYEMDSRGNIVPSKKHELSKKKSEFEHAQTAADAVLAGSS